MAITDIAGAAGGSGGAPGFPWVQAATAAVGAYQGAKAASSEVKRIGAETNQQLAAAEQATADFGVQALAFRQQRDLAFERADLAQRAEAEANRQSRLIENVDVNIGPTLEAQREARMRRRRFFDQGA